MAKQIQDFDDVSNVPDPTRVVNLEGFQDSKSLHQPSCQRMMVWSVLLSPKGKRIVFGQIIATSHDLTPKGSVLEGNCLISRKSRLVKCFNLAR